MVWTRVRRFRSNFWSRRRSGDPVSFIEASPGTQTGSIQTPSVSDGVCTHTFSPGQEDTEGRQLTWQNVFDTGMTAPRVAVKSLLL